MSFSFVPPPANGQQAHDTKAEAEKKCGTYNAPDLSDDNLEQSLGLGSLPKAPDPMPFDLGPKGGRGFGE
jgi:hypothetical protein